MSLGKRLNCVGKWVGLCSLLIATGSAKALIPHSNGFEAPADTAEWFQTGTVDSITRVPSSGGTLLYPSSGGAFHAEVANSPSDYLPGYGTSVFTRSGGSVTPYAGDFYVALDIYVDTATWGPVGDGFWLDASPRNAGTGFSDFNAETNFRFEVPALGSVKVSAFTLGGSNVITTLTSSGWYTFVITFRKTGNLTTDPVFSDQMIYSASGMLMGTSSLPTLMASADLGGNSYEHWITVWKDGFANDMIAVDNSRTGFLPFAATLVVDDDGMASTTDCDAAVPAFSTIQAAINAASPGDTIKVCPGVYTEQVYVDKPLSLLGAQAGMDARTRAVAPAMESVIIPDVSSPDPSAGPFVVLIYVDADDVTIDGFTLDGDNPSLTSSVNYGGANIDAEDGISGFETSYDNVLVRNNIIKNLSYTGIDFYPSGTAACTGNEIKQNRIENLGGDFGDIGVLIYNDFYAAVDDNLLDDVSTGIQTGNFHLAGGPATISGNDVAARNVGIFHNLHYQNASNFTIANNDVSAVPDSYSSGYWVGMILWSLQTGVSATLTDNTVDGSGSDQADLWGYDIWNLPTTATPSITGGSVTGVTLGMQISNFQTTYLSAQLPGTDVLISGLNINADDVGIWVEDSASNINGSTVSASITGDTDISTNGTGILVEGPDASASITNNDNSISGNLIGIDVDAGSATITSNHIYDNGTGIRFTNGGNGSVNSNNFDDATDNGTDLRLDATAGAVTIGAGNDFAGDGYYIDNQSAQAYDLTANSTTFDETDPFRIEDRMFHALDAGASGRIEVIAGQWYVTTPGTGLSDEAIQRAVNAADSGDTVDVEPGTFSENVTLNKSLNMKGAQSGVDARGRVIGVANPAVESVISPASGTVVLLVTGSAGSTIDGFAITGGAAGVMSSSGPLNELQIKNNDFRGLSASAVFLNDPGVDITVDKNALDGASQAGGALFHLDTDSFSGFHFTNNWLQNRTGGTGFFVDGNRNVNPSINRNPLFSGNLIKKNLTGMNSGSRAILGTSPASPAQVIDNIFDGNTFDGFQGGPKWTDISGNQFVSNGRNALALTSFGNLAADRGAQFCTVTCNNFQNNGFANTGSAVSFSATQAAGTISSNTLNNNNLRGNRVGATYTGAESINAESNWWGTFDGPSGTGPGTGDSIVGAGVDFSPFLVAASGCAPASSTLSLGFDKACYKPNETATVTLSMADLQSPAAGFQAFLAYDTARLTLVSWTYTATPFGLPVLTAPALVNPSPGILNLASGIDQFGGQSPTSADADLVILTFTVLGPDTCPGSIGNLITFRTNNPPTRLTDISGASILPTLTIDAPAITIDGTAPVITHCPPDITIQCHESTEPGIPFGTIGGGVMIYYNLTGPEAPHTQAYLKGQFSYANDNGAPFAFNPVPLTGFGPLTWPFLFGQVAPPTQFGFDFVLPAATNDSSVAVPVLNTYNNVDNSAANRALDGACVWKIGDYKDGAPNGPGNAANVDINSIIRGPNPGNPLTDLVITQFDLSLSGTVYTAQIAGKLVSDGQIHWYNPATPNSPMSNFGLDGEFFFSGTLTYDSAGDDGTDRKDFYSGTIILSANSPNTALGFALATDNCTQFPTISYTDVNNLGGCNGTGTITRTWKAVDCAGNESTCIQIITVEDTTDPVISCPAGSTVECEDDIPAAYADVAAFITAGGTASDNCTAPAGLTLLHVGDGALVGGPCGGTITRTYRITDACGNDAECTQVFTVNDTIAPVASSSGAIAACYPSVALAEAAALANSSAIDNCDASPVAAASTVGDCSAVVSVTFTDWCNNVSNVLTYNTRIDNTAPLITCPTDIVVTPPAGTCNAMGVVITDATATDNCTADVDIDITGVRSDALPLTDPYPQGVTTITWTAEDECGNTSMCDQTVTVEGVSITVAVELSPSIAPLPLNRCITFEVYDCVSNTTQSHSQVLTFVSDEYSPGFFRALANATICVPSSVPSTYNCVTARDELHTLRSRVTIGDGLTQNSGTTFTADFTGNRTGEPIVAIPPPTPGSGHRLVGGNLNDDIFIDILDFGTWAGLYDFNFPTGYGTGNTTCSTAFPHADISGDGLVGIGDFSFIAINFLMVSENNCCSMSPLMAGGEGDEDLPIPHSLVPVTSITVQELIARGLGHLAVGDVNRDGVLDQQDMAAVFGGQTPTPIGKRVKEVQLDQMPTLNGPDAEIYPRRRP